MVFPLKTSSNLRHIPISKITPNPYQPRKVFERDALIELSESIDKYGVITPLTVRKDGDEYLLIAGERRLRASKMAGLNTVPCYILDVDDKTSSVLALVENLQRKDLDPFEEALGLLRLTRDFDMTQQRAAEQVGKTQAAVANKLRLLKLAPETIHIIRQNGLTERHGRALLAIENEDEQATVARYIVEKQMNVSQTEAYIERLKTKSQKPKARRQIFIKDIRFFLNSVNHAVNSVRSAGIDAKCTQTTEDGSICLTIVIPNQDKSKAHLSSI